MEKREQEDYFIQRGRAKMDRKGQKPAFEDYIKRMKAKGLPGEEALKFVMSLLN